MAALGGDPLTAIHINIPSVNAPVMPGSVTTERTFTNTSGGKLDVSLSASAPDGSTITVSPKKLKVNAGASATFTVTITSDAPLDEQQFGEIRLAVKKGSTLHLPVAFVHTQGAVSLTQSCDPETITVGATSTCDIAATNLGFDEQTVSLSTTVNNRLKIVDADGATVSTNGKTATGPSVTLAGAQPAIPAVEDAGYEGYLALSGFGLTPDHIGDEEIINFNVPAFIYGGVTYTSIGVDSNGYVLPGGGDLAEDNNCCNIPAGPDAAPPNNMLAGFWTDLEGTDAPGIFAAVLSGGGLRWLVIEYQVEDWGTETLRTFQFWIGLNGEEDITYSYKTDFAAPVGQDFLVGAENVLGQGEMTDTLPTTDDLRIVSSDPIPGDSATYSVTVRGLGIGTGIVTTTMTADGVIGRTIVKSSIAIE